MWCLRCERAYLVGACESSRLARAGPTTSGDWSAPGWCEGTRADWYPWHPEDEYPEMPDSCDRYPLEKQLQNQE